MIGRKCVQMHVEDGWALLSGGRNRQQAESQVQEGSFRLYLLEYEVAGAAVCSRGMTPSSAGVPSGVLCGDFATRIIGCFRPISLINRLD